VEFGTIKINLNKLIEERGISKYKLGLEAHMHLRQINGFCDNTITRADFNVLGRLCTALDCEISDLLEYVPPKKSEK